MSLRDEFMTRIADKELERETVSVYLPVVRIFILLLTMYYGVVTLFNVTGETGAERIGYTSTSILSMIALGIAFYSLKPHISMLRLELTGAFGNAVMLANVLYIYTFGFDPERLIYFLLMVFLFAMTGATRRVTIVSSLAAMAGLYSVILYFDPSLTQDYLYIGFACCFAGVGGSVMFRRIITRALNAKLEAAARKTEALDAAARATSLAVTDALTGLPNRRAFFQTLEERSAEPSSGHDTLAVLLVDLDGFKPVNDTYGHSVGDELLIAVGKRLAGALKSTDYLARIGGDEFAVVTSVGEASDAKSIGERLCAVMQKPFRIDRIIVHVGATVGTAAQSQTKDLPNSLVECADYALFHAKRNLKGGCAIFTASDASVMTHLFVVDQALRGSNLEDELEVVYQPQFDMASDSVKGFEALARWNSRDLGSVDTSTFISVAETSGQITRITQVLLRKAMADIVNWPKDVTMSFNLSVHDILDISSIDEILDIVGESGVDASRICFEITETVMMGDVDKASVALQKLVDAGHKVALDDFGTGYSNFSYLHDLPIHKIKIDRSLIRNVAQSEHSTKMISTLLQLTRSLNKDCVIEGVETEAEFAAMRGLGARTVQGYYCGRPMSANAAFDLVNSKAPPASDKVAEAS